MSRTPGPCDERGARDDAVADVQLLDLADPGDPPDIDIVQAVTGADPEAKARGKLAASATLPNSVSRSRHALALAYARYALRSTLRPVLLAAAICRSSGQ